MATSSSAPVLLSGKEAKTETSEETKISGLPSLVYQRPSGAAGVPVPTFPLTDTSTAVPLNALVSSSEVKTVEETLVWKIPSYSLLRGKKHGEHIDSNIYEVGDKKFNLCLHPRGFHSAGGLPDACQPVKLHTPTETQVKVGKRWTTTTTPLTVVQLEENKIAETRKCRSMQENCFSLYLESKNDTVVTTSFKFEINVRQPDGQFYSAAVESIDLKPRGSWGFPAFYTVDIVPPGDCLIITVPIKVQLSRQALPPTRAHALRMEDLVLDADRNLLSSYQSAMLQRRKDLIKASTSSSSLDEGDGTADVVKIVSGNGGTVHVAHRFVLETQSKVFKAMLEPKLGFVESKERHVPLHDHTDDLAIDAMIEFMYVGAVTGLPSSADKRTATLSELLRLAHFFQIKSLEGWCWQRLSAEITTDSLAEILVVADKYGAADLKATCLEFVAEEQKHMEQVRKTTTFAQLRHDLVGDIYAAAYEKKINAGPGARKRKATDEPPRWDLLLKAHVDELNDADVRDALRFHKQSDKGMPLQLRCRLKDVLKS